MPLSPGDLEKLIIALDRHTAALLTIAVETVAASSTRAVDSKVFSSSVTNIYHEMLDVVNQLQK
jgi:hypothetical protein